MPVHLRDNLVAHVSLQAAWQKKLEEENEKLKQTVAKQEEEIIKLSKDVEVQHNLLSVFQSMIHPVTLFMTEFTRRRQVEDDWISTPFYSFSHGYKMCIRVHPNGILAGISTWDANFRVFLPDEWRV